MQHFLLLWLFRAGIPKMSFVTLVALVTFLAPKTAPSPLVRWVLYKSKLKSICRTDSKMVFVICYDYFRLFGGSSTNQDCKALASLLHRLWKIVLYKSRLKSTCWTDYAKWFMSHVMIISDISTNQNWKSLAEQILKFCYILHMIISGQVCTRGVSPQWWQPSQC